MRTVYNQKYQNTRYFNYKHWMFAPYIRALVKRYNISSKSCILDLGSGTGFFTRLFSEAGINNVVGIDISDVGVRAARATSRNEIGFVVGDGVNKLPFKTECFDLIFCRGFSSYNVEDFATNSTLTKHLMNYLRTDGHFVFAYSSDGSGLPGRNYKRVGRKSNSTWINQSLSDVKQHFYSVASVDILDLFFLTRLEMICLGQLV